MPEHDIVLLREEFNKFINKHRCRKEEPTHTILPLFKGGPAGKFCFKGKVYQDFLDKYVELVKLGEDLHFVERPNENGVTFLLIDVDYDQKGSKRVYTEEHIKEIIETINEFVQENFNVADYQLTSFVTEKAKPSKRDNNPNRYKDGFHIYYPYLPLEEKHRYFITDYLSDLMQADEFLDGIDYKNDVTDIFDMSVIKINGIMMIGSKKVGGCSYSLTHMYDFEMNELDTQEFDSEELIYTLSNRRFDVDSKIEVNDDDDDLLERIDNIYKQYGGGNKKKKSRKNNESRSSKSQSNHQNKQNKRNNQDNQDNDKKQNKQNKQNKQCDQKRSIADERDIALAKELAKILSKKRAHDYVSWRRTGFALRAIDDSLYDDFIAFSKKDMGKYKEDKVTCDDIWRAGANYTQFYDIETLKHWARMDNSKEYYKIMRQLNDDLFGKAETGQHVDIATVVHALYKGRFVCIDIAKKKWLEFQDHRWVHVQSAYTLEELISDEVRKIMRIYYSDKLHEIANGDNYNIQDDIYKKYAKLMNQAERLGDVKFREYVVKACANKFHDPDFQGKLDTNVYLVGFLNGVYDLKEGCFRDGLPSDYISKTVGYDWMDFNGDEPVFDKINKFFSEVQMEEDMRTYILTFIAKCLRGVPDSKLHMWTGGGGNGKSATIDLINNMLGDYFGVVPVTILTRKRNGSGNATPELADKFGKRFLVIQEPEHNDVVYVGQMKEYTGKDKIMARPLYGDPFYYVPQFTMVLTCNILPYIPATDNGTWRRLRVAPFESEFVDENPTQPNQFLKDEDLQEDFPNWAQPLMWLVITRYYPIYEKGFNNRKYKIYEPEKVKSHTNDYKIGSDVYAEFLEEWIDKTDDKKDVESIESVNKQFKEWYFNSYTQKPPPKKILVAYLKKNGFKVERNNVYGIKVHYSANLS